MNPEAGDAAVIVGATGGIGAALADAAEASGRFTVVHRLSRSSSPAIDLEDETSIEEAAALIACGPTPTLIIVATGVLHHGQAPERSYRALTAEHMLRDYRIIRWGPRWSPNTCCRICPGIAGRCSRPCRHAWDRSATTAWAAGTAIGLPRRR